jgi:hypothetical protein
MIEVRHARASFEHRHLYIKQTLVYRTTFGHGRRNYF